MQKKENPGGAAVRSGTVSQPRTRRKKFLSAQEQSELDNINRKGVFYNVMDEVSAGTALRGSPVVLRV